MKNIKPKTPVKKTTKTTSPCDEISIIKRQASSNYERVTNLWVSLSVLEDSMAVYSSNQQVMFYAIVMANILGVINLIWLFLK